MTDEPASIGKTRLDIFSFQPGITLEDGFRRVTGGQHAEDVLDCQTASTNNRLAAENARVDGDACEKELLIHGRPHRMIAHLRTEENL
jgi:hypothetical protein